MVIKFLKEKWKRIALIIVGSVTAAILIGAFFLNLYWSPVLSAKLKSTVLASTDGLYKINFTDAELHILRGKIVIYNLDFEPDTAVYRQKYKQHLAPNNIYKLHIKKLVLTHTHPLGLYFKNRLDIGEIVLSAPELHIAYQLNNKGDTATKDTRTIYQRIAKTLKSIHIGHIMLNDVQFKYEDYSGNKVAISELREMNLNATDLLIDSATQTDKSRFYFCKDVTTEINNFSGKTLNGLYRYKMKLLKLSTRTSQLNAEDIDVTPADTGFFFRKTYSERFSFHLDSLQLNHFDFLTYHKYRKLTATSLNLSGGVMDIFSNPNEKPGNDKTDKTKTFPNAGLFDLRTDLKIDTINVHEINVRYTEIGRKSKKEGTLVFNHTAGQFFNVTTNPAALAKNNLCRIAVVAFFMNKARLDANFTFNLIDKSLPYSYKGLLGPMNLSALNTVTRPLAMVKVTSGKLKSLAFDIKGDKYMARGSVTMLYNDLKVTLLKMDSVQNKYKHLTLASFFANAMIIKHNNPDDEGVKPRSMLVNYKRPPEFPFFKTIWKTMLIGIKACAGYGEQKEKDVKSQIAQRAVEKQERKIKKAERIQKREDRKKARELKQQMEAGQKG